jgi:nucleoside phosphorylase
VVSADDNLDVEQRSQIGDVLTSTHAGIMMFDVKEGKVETKEPLPPTLGTPGRGLLSRVSAIAADKLKSSTFHEADRILTRLNVAAPKRERERKFGFGSMATLINSGGIIDMAMSHLKDDVQVRSQLQKLHKVSCLDDVSFELVDYAWRAGKDYLIVRGVSDVGQQQSVGSTIVANDEHEAAAAAAAFIARLLLAA